MLCDFSTVISLQYLAVRGNAFLFQILFLHVDMCSLGDTSESLEIDEISKDTYVVCMH